MCHGKACKQQALKRQRTIGVFGRDGDHVFVDHGAARDLPPVGGSEAGARALLDDDVDDLGLVVVAALLGRRLLHDELDRDLVDASNLGVALVVEHVVGHAVAIEEDPLGRHAVGLLPLAKHRADLRIVTRHQRARSNLRGADTRARRRRAGR